MKERILVTGGTGYIGSHTVVELQNSGYEVIIIDNLSNSSADVVDNIEKVSGIRPVFEKLDCLDFAGLDAVFAKYKGIKAIIHFAASKAVVESVQKPLLYYRNNLVSLINLLELMPKHGVEGIVFSSSCTVYGQPDELPVTEKAPIKKAESPYGNTKQINEEIIRDTVASGAPINAIMLRYFLIAMAVREKDNFEEVTVKAKVARKDKDGKRVKEVVDGKKVTVYDEVDKTIKKDMPSRLHARRQMLKVLYPVKEVPTAQAGKKKNTKEVDLVAKLFDEIAPKYADRNGGYTRIVKIGQRKGDGALEVLIELV